MISDVLSEAVAEIDRYLTTPTFSVCYVGEMRQRIRKCRNEMEAIRRVLDTPPSESDKQS